MVFLKKFTSLVPFSLLFFLVLFLLFLLEPQTAFCYSGGLPYIANPLTIEQFQEISYLRTQVLEQLQALGITDESLPLVMENLQSIHHHLPNYIPDSHTLQDGFNRQYGLEVYEGGINLLDGISINNLNLQYQPILDMATFQQFYTNIMPFHDNSAAISRFVERSETSLLSFDLLVELSFEWEVQLKNDPAIDFPLEHIELGAFLYDFTCDFIRTGTWLLYGLK